MRPVDVIRKKRDGKELAPDEIGGFIAGCAGGEVPDYQVSAWLMAVVLRGLSGAELAALTDAMLHSGEVLDLSHLPGRKIDKHSTGGVGDKTSLVLAPVAAAGGLVVPMISGRGLAHTGGTLDKLESIPGFRVSLTAGEFLRAVAACGCAIAGPTDRIAPADRKLYALRDVTATVDCPELICASIMSKKLAEGIDALVLDVKCGDGAFMKTEEEAVRLARLMVETGARMGTRTVALITGMDQPLGKAVGNALEVAECVAVLRDAGPEDLRALCLELAAWMFHLGGCASGIEAGRVLAREIISSRRGLEKFRDMVGLQGGDPGVIDDPARLPRAANSLDILSPGRGVVAGIASEQVGTACVALGGGRRRKEDRVDPAVGVLLHKKAGDPVEEGEPLCTIRYNAAAGLSEAHALLGQAFRIARAEIASPAPLVRRVIRADD
jgi:pyrimidine-nucleoside phosphorylase